METIQSKKEKFDGAEKEKIMRKYTVQEAFHMDHLG